MLDFTSALYLGFEHASWGLPGWARLTLGKPAALEEVPGALQAQRELAALTGCERVLLGSSTLHLFCDLFAMLAGRNTAIWIDEGAYPIARWGTDRAAVLGVPVRVFPHHDAAALRKAMSAHRGTRPVIVTDGYSPIRGTPAPLPDYARCAAEGNGLLIVDDTQALGVFGWQAQSMVPYGVGGGGSLRCFNLRDPRIVVVSSLAKAFGVPVAMLGGSPALVERFRENSATLVHCSPPSAAAISAALRALQLNVRFGDALRHRLAERVARFRRGLPDLLAVGSLFPVQPLKLSGRIDARALYRALLGRGVRPVLHRDASNGGSRISFVLTARHRPGEIDYAVESLTDALARGPDERMQRSQNQCHPDTIKAYTADRGIGEAADGNRWMEAHRWEGCP
jgi:8-amino-7-oxononanoate synthase